MTTEDTPQPRETRCIAFAGSSPIASGELKDVALQVKQRIDGGEPAAILIFDETTSAPIEIDFRGSAGEVVARLTGTETPRRPGRPKLGVVAREVTLLPRHWEWLSSQPGGASVALRKLVEEARRANAGKDRVRQAQEAAYRFMTAMAGDEAGYEEATRALFAGRADRFDEMTASWPAGVRDHARKLAAAAFQPGEVA